MDTGVHNSHVRVKSQVASKFGVAAKSMDLSYPEHSNMAAKLIWQHYRQAMDKEWNVSCFIIYDIFFT